MNFLEESIAKTEINAEELRAYSQAQVQEKTETLDDWHPGKKVAAAIRLSAMGRLIMSGKLDKYTLGLNRDRTEGEIKKEVWIAATTSTLLFDSGSPYFNEELFLEEIERAYQE